MTVVVGYLAGKCGHAPLNLAVRIARLLNTSLVVTTVVPKPWPTPSPAKVDAEFSTYANQLGADSQHEAQEYLASVGAGVDIGYRQVASRTAGEGLLRAVAAADADLLVVGSSAEADPGRVLLGSTTDWLVHSCPVPLAVSPRDYRYSPAGLSRITCAYSGSRGSQRLVRRMVRLTKDLDVALRVVSYAIRGRTMFPPEVGLHAEDSLLQTWAGQLRELGDKLERDGVIGKDVAVQVITGTGWDQVLQATEWTDGDILALGSSARRSIKGVFLGSHGAKIIRHSPVPVLVLPN